MKVTESMKTFYSCLQTLIYVSRRLGFERGKLVCWFAKERDNGGDYLTIFRDDINNYIISFDSCKGHNWRHEGCRLKDVVYALQTWDSFKFEPGWFEY